MKLLFAYRYGGIGGVETQILQRMRYLRGVADLEVEFLFAKDYGAGALLSEYGRVHFEPDPKKLGPILESVDVAAVIDTEEYLDAIVSMGKRVLLEIHTTVDSGIGYLERKHAPKAYLVPSEYSKRMIRDRFGIDAGVVPDIVDPTLFAPAAVPEHRDPIVLWVGRLDSHKGYERILEMTSLLLLEHRAELWMVGGETSPKEVQRHLIGLAEDLGLDRRFRWFPRIAHLAMPRLYAYAAQSGGALVSTSLDESFGMSILEALLSGLPVVSSDVGAVSELGTSPYLSLYPLDDPAAGVDRIARALSERASLRAALSNARPSLARRFSPETVGPRYVEVLERVMA